MSLLSLVMKMFDVATPDQWKELVSSKAHSQPIRNHRVTLLKKRISFFAVLFGVVVPLWIMIDVLLLPYALWGPLAILRILSGVVFLFIAYRIYFSELSLEQTVFYLSVFLYTPSVFFLLAQFIFAGIQLEGVTGALVGLYSLLPFLAMAALSIFPLTIREFSVLSVPVVVISSFYLLPETVTDLPAAVMQIWLLALIVSVSFFSSVSQMRYMISLVTTASYDPLTRAITRRAGIELLELQIKMSVLQSQPLSLVFLDIDHFKSLNDDYGHDAGDNALKEVVVALKKSIRKGDSVVRWGGEEFLLILPNADCNDTNRVVNRIFVNGLGLRPDNSMITASMGVSELNEDNNHDWADLVNAADVRMYKAKKDGRARCACCNGQMLVNGYA